MTPATIARALSKAQKKALMWLSEEPQAWPKGSEVSLYALANWQSGDASKCPAIVAKMCRVVGTADPAKGRIWGKSLWQITPCGLAVRAELQERETSHDA